jgi:hypothetical protein
MTTILLTDLADVYVNDTDVEHDIIYGLRGDDQLTAFGLNGDTIFAGFGNDAVHDGIGGDSILGGYGADQITVATNHDFVNGQGGNDTITFNTDDFVMGGSGNDTLVYDERLRDFAENIDFGRNATANGGRGADLIRAEFVLDGKESTVNVDRFEPGVDHLQIDFFNALGQQVATSEQVLGFLDANDDGRIDANDAALIPGDKAWQVGGDDQALRLDFRGGDLDGDGIADNECTLFLWRIDHVDIGV